MNVLVQHLCRDFDHANIASSFRGFKYLPKFRFNNVYVSKYEHILKIIIFNFLHWDSGKS